jgi:hypothetical protein
MLCADREVYLVCRPLNLFVWDILPQRQPATVVVVVVVGFYYIHPKAHKVGQPLCDSLVVAARYHSSRFLLYPPEGA